MSPEVQLSPEDLKVFLEEAEELIELLDRNIIRLEANANDGDLLQEIFRAAHTLKGSSGMIGFRAMAELTHAMEDVLDGLRTAKCSVTAALVDALLQALDGLKALQDGLKSGSREPLDIQPLQAALSAAKAAASAPAAADSPLTEAAIVSDPGLRARAEEAIDSGMKLFRVEVTIGEGGSWSSVTCFLLLRELSARSQVLCSVPSQEEIEDGAAASHFRAVVASNQTRARLRAALEGMDGVQSLKIEAWRFPEPASVATEASDGLGSTADAKADERGELPGAQLQMNEPPKSVRIDVGRLDALVDTIGELVVGRNRIDQISRGLQSRYGDDPLVNALGDATEHVAKLVDDLHDRILQVRMLPIAMLFGQLPRLVRDLGQSTGKRVQLVLEGQETEIDRSVIEKMREILVHLLRNAVDHGIEPPEVRRAAGKPELGVVTVSACHDQGHVVIAVEDDGKGVDLQRVREGAARAGIMTADMAHRLSDREALDLIFQPNVSSASTATEISGRGVGMDVVKRKTEALGGLIQVDTSAGAGTRISLRLPLTLATFRGLLVQCSQNVYAIPLTYVQETVRPEAGAITTVMGRQVLNLRGNVVPLLRLGSGEHAGGNGSGGGERFVVVVRVADKRLAFAVDALVDQQEIVVKSPGEYVGQTEGIAGVSILGDGRVVLILDVASLARVGAGVPGEERVIS